MPKNSDKPTVMIPIGVYLPAHTGGGPIRSVSNLVERLSDEFDFRVLTSSENLHEASGQFDYTPGEWLELDGGKVRYLDRGERRFFSVVRRLVSLDFDVVYLNAFFPTPFTLPVLALNWLGLLGAPVVLAPRGQFYPGAFEQNRWKKQPFVQLARTIGLYDGIIWQATSRAEAEQIRDIFGPTVSIKSAPNLGSLPGDDNRPVEFSRPSTEPGELSLVFLSRISRKKNLDGALEYLSHLDGHVEFDIFGPVWDDDYWEECRSRIRNLPDNIDVTYHGAVPHDEVFGIFGEHDLFLFPTQSENYGHVIFESLISGCPVLTSTETPWTDLEEAVAGWSYDLESDNDFIDRLQWCIDADESTYRQIRRNARDFAKEKANDSTKIEQNRRLFQFALKRSRIDE